MDYNLTLFKDSVKDVLLAHMNSNHANSNNINTANNSQNTSTNLTNSMLANL